MPLSPAHPSVVLPLQRAGLPLAALVVGAVAPDAPVYLPVGVSYATTHSWAGLPASTLIGLVVLALWHALLRDAVVDLVEPLRHRAPERVRPDRRAWLLAPVAVALAAATHVLWDSATHDWGFVVESVGLLREDLGPLPVYRWAQHTSTVLGTAVVAWYAVRVLGRRTVTPRAAGVPRPGLWLAAVPGTALVTGVVLLDAERAVGAGLLALLVVALFWQVAARRPA